MIDVVKVREEVNIYIYKNNVKPFYYTKKKFFRKPHLSTHAHKYSIWQIIITWCIKKEILQNHMYAFGKFITQCISILTHEYYYYQHTFYVYTYFMRYMRQIIFIQTQEFMFYNNIFKNHSCRHTILNCSKPHKIIISIWCVCKFMLETM